VLAALELQLLLELLLAVVAVLAFVIPEVLEALLMLPALFLVVLAGIPVEVKGDSPEVVERVLQ